MTDRCKRLQGKIALVTASTAGIGLAIARRLSSEGAIVCISSRKQSNVDEAVQELRSQGLAVSGSACHVGDDAQIQALVDKVVSEHGRIDILVSNAAVNPASGPIIDLDSSAIDKILDINVRSAVILAKKVVPHMPKNKESSSSIVFVSSYSAFAPSAPIAMYAVSKTALLGLTKALAEELGPDGIRVNCIAPGVIPTKFANALVADQSLKEMNEARTYLGRLGKAEEIAATCAFLVSDDASYITGETIVAAGGMQSRL